MGKKQHHNNGKNKGKKHQLAIGSSAEEEGSARS
jgi:hypothetical protein